MQLDENRFEPPLPEPPEPEPITCQLANGHSLRIVAALWSRWRTYQEWVLSIRPEPYFAIRIYCSEETIPKRLVWVEEFCEETDFHIHDCPNIWQWLAALCKSPAVFAFDDVGEFLDEISEGIIRFSTAEPDAVEHIEHLPEITDPEAFDKMDDSIFNDQNDGEPDR